MKQDERIKKVVEYGKGKTSTMLYQEALRYYRPYLDILNEIDDADGELTPELEARYELAKQTYLSKPELRQEIIDKIGKLRYVIKKKTSVDLSLMKQNKQEAEILRKRADKRNNNLRALVGELMDAIDEDKVIDGTGKSLVYFTYGKKVIFDEKLFKQLLIDWVNNDEFEPNFLEHEELFFEFVEECFTIQYVLDYSRKCIDVKMKINQKKALAFITVSNQKTLEENFEVYVTETKSLTIR